MRETENQQLHTLYLENRRGRYMMRWKSYSEIDADTEDRLLMEKIDRIRDKIQNTSIAIAATLGIIGTLLLSPDTTEATHEEMSPSATPELSGVPTPSLQTPENILFMTTPNTALPTGTSIPTPTQ